MSRSPSTSYHHGDLRGALVDAAVALVEEHSPARLSLREVARAAGVSHAAPYHHFSDRGDLLKAAGDRCMGDFLAAQESAVAAHDDPDARLVALGEAYVGYAAAHPHAFALVFDPELCPPGDPSPERAVLITRNEELLAACVVDLLVARGRDVGHAPALANALWGTVHGLAALVGDGHLPLDAVGPALEARLTL
ncbi:TetR/AcrR family transcriptional regulator [uncultured Nocardioides sp.]|uniref:TetR/AcrR family transcriptional regulator n=1 Tax=uncultured Nocardioides sp. TaxID=198441 RepID=UPI002618135E|nr:TetR/AcrR family transcriptional regulator [uncultured Nocardioides sp.]